MYIIHDLHNYTVMPWQFTYITLWQSYITLLPSRYIAITSLNNNNRYITRNNYVILLLRSGYITPLLACLCWVVLCSRRDSLLCVPSCVNWVAPLRTHQPPIFEANWGVVILRSIVDPAVPLLNVISRPQFSKVRSVMSTILPSSISLLSRLVVGISSASR